MLFEKSCLSRMQGCFRVITDNKVTVTFPLYFTLNLATTIYYCYTKYPFLLPRSNPDSRECFSLVQMYLNSEYANKKRICVLHHIIEGTKLSWFEFLN